MTTSNDSLRQASVRAVTGTALDYNSDWHALFDGASVPKGTFNERMIQWVSLKLGGVYATVEDAVQALASFFSAFNFSSLGTFDATLGALAALLLESGGYLLQESGFKLLLE